MQAFHFIVCVLVCTFYVLKESSSFPSSWDWVHAEEEWEARGSKMKRPSQGYFCKTHYKDMEMKHLYATWGPSLFSQPGPTNLSCFCSLVPVEDSAGEQAEMNETNNPTVRRKSGGEGHDGVNTRVKACRSTVLFLRQHRGVQEGEEKTGCEVAWKWEFCIIHGPSGGGWTVAGTCLPPHAWGSSLY